MKKINLFMIMILAVVLLLPNMSCQQTQTKATPKSRQRLAILPFTGGDVTEGEALAKLFSLDPKISDMFTRVPRTSTIDAITKEQQYHASTGLTDSDTIAKLGKLYNADCVLVGHFQKLGERKLLHITVVDVISLQRIAGDYKEYNKIEELEKMIPEMAKQITKSAEIDRSTLRTLALFPFDIPEDVNKGDAEVLAQILATELANSGQYSVLPRMSALYAVMDKHSILHSALTDEENIKKIGKELNVRYVLCGGFTKYGSGNKFLVEVISAERGTMRRGKKGGTSENYENISDGFEKMKLIAQKLTGTEVAVPADFILIEGGSCVTGSPSDEVGRYDNEAEQRVTVSSFYISKYEVTQKEWFDIMGTTIQEQREKAKNPLGETSDLVGEGNNYPMYYVNWNEAVRYCNERSIKEGLIPAYDLKNRDDIKWNKSANGYRLPTEDEWEYACRADSRTAYSTGAKIRDNVGWYSKNSGKKTHEVGKKKSNAWGLFDMHGNVSEWCWDLYRYNKSDTSSQVYGVGRVLRGGAFDSEPQNLRSAYREDCAAHTRYSNVGFRVVRSQ